MKYLFLLVLLMAGCATSPEQKCQALHQQYGGDFDKCMDRIYNQKKHITVTDGQLFHLGN